MRLHCKSGEHYWEKTSRGRPPIDCPEHRVEKKIVVNYSAQNPAHDNEKKQKSIYDIIPELKDLVKEENIETLHCEFGEGHEWQRESRRGKRFQLINYVLI